ncbi:MAG: c-type cytochrome biogenesis protein CcsB [Solobacterium sp.]|nr:c-type cytochrome biogenesis protein CcsB [Solobacterium sp.]
MLDVLFFAGLILYFAAMILQFLGASFRKDNLKQIAWFLFLAGFICSFAYLAARGIKARRFPMSNQFEFAATFSFGIALILIIMKYRIKADWLLTTGIPMVFLILSYAAFQPRGINELMPALRSVWFVFHIGTAAFSYACFVLAGAAGIRYLYSEKKGTDQKELEDIDFMIYRLISLGLLLLTVTIVSGAIWAEQAWSSFWTWDPKEVWALITWLLYSIYLHLRLNRKWRGHRMAVFAVLAVPVVLFTFVGVNTLMPGLHSYGAVTRELL